MKETRKKKRESARQIPARVFSDAASPANVASERNTPRREAMTLPGFGAETSLYKTIVDYQSRRTAVPLGFVTPQQLLHLFCRPTDCACQKAACVRGGGIVVPSDQLPCYFTCERR
jgi:hypothetical protein